MCVVSDDGGEYGCEYVVMVAVYRHVCDAGMYV